MFFEYCKSYKSLHFKLIIGILLLSNFIIIGQKDTSFHARIEAQVYASDTGITPFWMRSLQYGQVPLENPGAVVRAWAGKNYQWKKKYDWKYELEATGWGGKQNDFWLTQAYVSGRRGKWELWAGRRKEVYGLGDSSLTGGFYAWSGNAVPVPKVQIGTRDYINFAKGWLGVHMTFSHGWMDNQGFVLNSMLHQKSIYLRIGKAGSLVNLFGGLNHNVVWGGENQIKTGSTLDYRPSSLNAYFYVITAIKDRTIIPLDINTSEDDWQNQYGNHLGSIDFAIKIGPTKWGKIFLYKQTAYETGRVFGLTTLDDGISGISFNFKNEIFIKTITFEYLYTANQGRYRSGLSQSLGLNDPHLSEIESYFNNNIRSWQYMGKSIGTPIIIIDKESIEGNGLYFSRNANESFYICIGGTFRKKINWIIRTSQSYHGIILKGDGNDKYVSYIPQFSASILLNKQFSQKLIIQTQIGIDNGARIKNTVGLNIGIKYQLK